MVKYGVYALVIRPIFVLCMVSALTCAQFAKATHPSCEDVKLQVLGSGGPEIDDGLASSSYLIWIKDQASILVDAGGGSSLNFERTGAKFNDIRAILLTHLHVDHSVDLPVYIKAGYFTDRKKNLSVLGPSRGGNFPSTEDFVAALFSEQGEESLSSVYPYLSDNFQRAESTDFLIKAESLPDTKKVWQHSITNQLKVSAVSVKHGQIPAIAWRVDYRGCSISFSGDMNGSSGNLELLAKNSDWLVAHNAIAENAGEVAKKLHMTPSKIGIIADDAKVQNLVLSHFMNRSIHKKKQSLQQIKKRYQGNIYFSDDLQTYNL
ncbi:MAG: MBL fold metallo-hydrolase [Kangiellaceae bacterium]